MCFKKGKKKFPIKLTKHDNKKIEINNEEEANKIINDLSQNDYRVEKVKKEAELKIHFLHLQQVHFNKKHLKIKFYN